MQNSDITKKSFELKLEGISPPEGYWEHKSHCENDENPYTLGILVLYSQSDI